MNSDDDTATVQECLNGNPQAFATIVERYEKPLFNVALRMLRNPEDARDVTQTAFLKAYQGLEKYDPQFRFYSWIYRIAINESLMRCGCAGARRTRWTTSTLPTDPVRRNRWPRTRPSAGCSTRSKASSRTTRR